MGLSRKKGKKRKISIDIGMSNEAQAMSLFKEVGLYLK